MQVYPKSITNQFDATRQFVIPLFQRPYVWTEEGQWAPLFDDVARVAEQELRGVHEIPPHFLGAVVIQQRKVWNDDIKAHDVIDGQQRMTTLQILLAAVRDIAAKMGDSFSKDKLISLTENTGALAKRETERFKVLPSNADRPHFEAVMTAGSQQALEEIYPRRYSRKRLLPRPRQVEAYIFFAERVQEWINEVPLQSPKRLEALRRAIGERLQIVSIELDVHEDPQAIFETLNARGVPLLAADLLRNDFFQRAGTEDAARLHAKYWVRFEASEDDEKGDSRRFWEVEIRQGRLYRARLDLFMKYYLAMQRGEEAATGQLFADYKRWSRLAPPPLANVEAELSEFGRFADLFRALLAPDDDWTHAGFAKRLTAYDVSTAYPLVLGILGNAKLTEADRTEIFRDLESFILRRMVCELTAKAYNRLFLSMLKEFKSGDQTAERFRAILADGTGETDRWPGDDDFRKAWMTLDAYKQLKAYRCEAILYAIDEAMRTSKTEAAAFKRPLSVEHVLPQKWKTHWPLPHEGDEAALGEAREGHVHDFGNLTLLSVALNSAVSNGPAIKKLPAIALNAGLRMNTYFQGKSSWDEADIRSRGEELFKRARLVWPGPHP